MDNKRLARLLLQLDKENKELLAITDQYILVYWYDDTSYVSWIYSETKEGKFVFDCGNYLKIENNVSKNEAIKQFSERINK